MLLPETGRFAAVVTLPRTLIEVPCGPAGPVTDGPVAPVGPVTAGPVAPTAPSGPIKAPASIQPLSAV